MCSAQGQGFPFGFITWDALAYKLQTCLCHAIRQMKALACF